VAHPAQRRWYPLVFVIAALVLLPLSVLLLSWQSIDTQIWSHLWDTQMPRLLGNTLTLIVGCRHRRHAAGRQPCLVDQPV
jgi:iron(III) transport system permease protein